VNKAPKKNMKMEIMIKINILHIILTKLR